VPYAIQPADGSVQIDTSQGQHGTVCLSHSEPVKFMNINTVPLIDLLHVPLNSTTWQRLLSQLQLLT